MPMSGRWERRNGHLPTFFALALTFSTSAEFPLGHSLASPIPSCGTGCRSAVISLPAPWFVTPSWHLAETWSNIRLRGGVSDEEKASGDVSKRFQLSPLFRCRKKLDNFWAPLTSLPVPVRTRTVLLHKTMRDWHSCVNSFRWQTVEIARSVLSSVHDCTSRQRRLFLLAVLTLCVFSRTLRITAITRRCASSAAASCTASDTLAT